MIIDRTPIQIDYLELFWDIVKAIKLAHSKQRAAWAKAYHHQLDAGVEPWKIEPYANEHAWWLQHVDKFQEPHGAVLSMLEQGYRAFDMHRLVLEWPHVSTKDHMRLAYTQSDKKGEAEQRTVTSVAKYLARHFGHCAPDHVIRDTAALSLKHGKMQITRDMKQIVSIIMDEDAVWSCMGSHNHPNFRDHPYRVYAADLGWALAYRTDEDTQELLGRALVYECGEHKCFVRTYQGDENHATNDIYLERWLADQGYSHDDHWPIGAALKLIESSDGEDYLAPYLDGDTQHVRVDEGEGVMTIRWNGPMLDSQHGRLERPGVECPHCGARVDHDDLYSHGPDGDGQHCSECDDDFLNVTGYRGYQYSLHKDDCIEGVDGDWYDREWMRDMVELTKGQHEDKCCHMEDTICDVDDEYWHVDDIVQEPMRDGVILVTAGCNKDQYVDADATFRCVHDGEVYSDEDGYTIIHNEMVADCNVDDYSEAKAEEVQDA